MLLKRLAGTGFDTRQVRVIEMMTRHIARTRCKTRMTRARGPADASGVGAARASQRSQLQLGRALHSPHADVDRLHVINENHGMHIGDAVIVRIAETISHVQLPPDVFAARLRRRPLRAVFPEQKGSMLRARSSAACATRSAS